MKTTALKLFLHSVLTVYLTLTAFFAESFILGNIHHDHDENGAKGSCLVCYQIETAARLVEALGRFGIIAAAAVSIFYVKKSLHKPSLSFCHIPTLISLKIRLNP